MPGSARSHCRACAQGKQPGRTPAHLNGHRETQVGWGFPGMSQESLPTLTAISEVITNGA